MTQAAPRSHVRTRVLGFAFSLTAITYLDRICISAAAPYTMRDLGLTVLEMSAVFSAFTLSSSLFEVPSGWLGDVIGPRRVLMRIVVWWPVFTMATGLDIAPDHAGVVTGWMNTLGNLGGLLGPLVVGFVVEEYRSWVVPFYIAAGMYVVGALAWLAINPNTLIEPPAIAADA